MAFTQERTVIKPLGFASWFTTLLLHIVPWTVLTTTYVYCMYCICVATATSVFEKAWWPALPKRPGENTLHANYCTLSIALMALIKCCDQTGQAYSR